MAKMGGRAWYTPGPPGLLHPPASSLWSSPRNFCPLLPPRLFHGAFTLLPPGLFPLSLSSFSLGLGRACKPFHPTEVSARESHHPLESVPIRTTTGSVYLLSLERLASSSGRPGESAALSGVLGGKAGGAYNRKVGGSRWQEMTRSRKQLPDKLLPQLCRGEPFGCFASATVRTAPPPPTRPLQRDSMKL